MTVTCKNNNINFAENQKHNTEFSTLVSGHIIRSFLLVSEGCKKLGDIQWSTKFLSDPGIPGPYI